MNPRPNQAMRVLFDGWALAYAPNSPAALHLLDLLPQMQQRVEPIIALPAETGGIAWLPPETLTCHYPLADTPLNRLRWEQRILPRLWRERRADLIHIFSLSPPLLSAPPTAISPTTHPGESPVPRRGATARLQAALARGAQAPHQAVLWPQDLELPQALGHIEALPALIPPDFNPSEAPDAQHLAALGVAGRPYVLYHGPKDHLSMRWVLAAWSWVYASLGEEATLVLVDCTPLQATTLMQDLQGLNLGESLYPLPPQPPQVLASLYRGAQAVFHPALSVPWGDTLRYALACAKPLVALETALSDALCGEAAYLIAERDTRKLGAALLSVLVDEALADALREKARARLRQWPLDDFTPRLLATYRTLLQRQ